MTMVVSSMTPPSIMVLLLTVAVLGVVWCQEPERTPEEWREVFAARTEDDWRNLWHQEKHRRCQQQLVAHMELVCEKDIYKLTRRKRSLLEDDADFDKDSKENSGEPTSHFFTSSQSAQLFGGRHLFRTGDQRAKRRKSRFSSAPEKSRRSGGLQENRVLHKRGGISDECCHGQDGCSWEEYAEYCPANVRVRY